MKEITFETIKNKLGFDPFVYEDPEYDPCVIDDSKPSVYKTLTREESRCLYNLIAEKLKTGELKAAKWD